MNLTTLVFGDRLYKIDQSEPSWHRPSVDDAAECAVCGEVLTFCFAPCIDESKAGIGTYYLTPTGIRCDCFLDGSQSTTLKREPVLITPVVRQSDAASQTGAGDYVYRVSLANEMRKACAEVLALPQPETDADHGEEI